MISSIENEMKYKWKMIIFNSTHENWTWNIKKNEQIFFVIKILSFSLLQDYDDNDDDEKWPFPYSVQ